MPRITKDRELEIQDLTKQYQQLSQTYSTIKDQIIQLDLESKEIDNAITELERVDGNTDVFKRTGSILIKKRAEDVLNELKSKKEILEVRIKRLKNQEEKLGKQLNELVKNLQAKMTR